MSLCKDKHGGERRVDPPFRRKLARPPPRTTLRSPLSDFFVVKTNVALSAVRTNRNENSQGERKRNKGRTCRKPRAKPDRTSIATALTAHADKLLTMPGSLISSTIAACALIAWKGVPQSGWVIERWVTEGEAGVRALPFEPGLTPCLSPTYSQFTQMEYEAQTS